MNAPFGALLVSHRACCPGSIAETLMPNRREPSSDQTLPYIRLVSAAAPLLPCPPPAKGRFPHPAKKLDPGRRATGQKATSTGSRRHGHVV